MGTDRARRGGVGQHGDGREEHVAIKDPFRIVVCTIRDNLRS